MPTSTSIGKALFENAAYVAQYLLGL
jgi:hypothetical protein